ncbi:MAG: hypothetical protein R2839_07320 [Thermomicrobiales bacterium]
MTDAAAIEAVSFDLDALIDLDGSLTAFLYAIALRGGHEAPPAGGVLFGEFAAIRDHQLLLPYRSFKRVMSDSLRVWCEQLGYAWIDAYADAMAMTLRSAPPFPDATRALQQAAAAGLTLVLVANTDHDVVCHSLNHLQTGFEAVLVSEDSLAYKPAPDLSGSHSTISNHRRSESCTCRRIGTATSPRPGRWGCAPPGWTGPPPLPETTPARRLRLAHPRQHRHPDSSGERLTPRSAIPVREVPQSAGYRT